ncbi:MAG TPA: HEAT repeat domain-containing protein [Phycisphaerae bacterium]|nr:HEAT repeat domain-containing protein [Phycisphaerae bacterium]
MMLVWMRAAGRVAPNLAEAHLRQYELLTLLGRAEEAHDALGRYCHLTDDEVRRLIWLGDGFEQLQSAEKRLEFCTARLADASLPGPIASELHRWLGETYAGMGEPEAANRQLQDAVDAFAFNFAAQDGLLQTQEGGPTAARRVRRHLVSIAAAPLGVGELWSLARLLDSVSLHDRAVWWYEQALAAIERGSTGRPAPSGLLVDMGRSLRDAGRFDRAIEVCQRALNATPNSYDAAMLLIEAARAAGQDGLAEQQVAGLRSQLDKTEGVARRGRDALSAARIAWFHTVCDPDPQRALEFAELAQAGAANDPEVRRIYGLAQLEAGQAAEARETLAPLVTGQQPDQLAAWGLARALIELGDKESALEILRDAEQVRRSGMAYERVCALLQELGATPLPPPDRSSVERVLDAFDRDVMNFPVDPAHYLEFTAEFVDPTPTFGQRWPCRLRLTNRGTFPITLGAGQMVAGDVLLSATVDYPGIGVMEGYLSVSLAQRHALGPGESVELVQTVDVGVLAPWAVILPQRDLILTVTALLDPVQQPEGGWKSRLGDELVATARMQRLRFTYERSTVTDLARQTRQGPPPERVDALRTVAALLEERLATMREKLDYTPVRIDKKGLEATLRAGLTDPSPMVRAHMLDNLGLFRFSDEQAGMVAPLLSDEDWVVRLMAVDFLAARQGTVFERVARRLAESDADPLVRELAGLYVERWRAARMPETGGRRR